MKYSCVSILAMQLLLLPSGSLKAQITAEASQSRLRTPAEVTNRAAQFMGAYDPSQKLRLVIGLKLPKQDELHRFVENLYKEGSPEYRHFLTPKEFNDRFSPSAADEQAVVDWATSQGLTVTKRFPNRLIVDVEGQVSQIQKAMGVNINRYQFRGAAVFSNDRDPVIPPELSGVVDSVLGLNSIQVLEPHSKMAKGLIHPNYSAGPAKAMAAEGRANGDRSMLEAARAAKKQDGVTAGFINGSFDPIDIYGSNAYNFDGLYNLGHCCNPNHVAGGTPPETSIAIATAGAQQLSDMEGFHKQFPYLAYNITYFNVDGTPTCCDFEGTMDAQWSTAMANSFGATDDTAHVYVYQGVNNRVATFVDVFNHILTDGHARVLSVSWGCAEAICDTTAWTTVVQALSAQGWTLVADADDKGSTADCAHVLAEFPASSPDVIAAGGTTLFLGSTGYINETAWVGSTTAGSCANNNGGGGGGRSNLFAVPPYQAYLGYGTRVLPDISLNAIQPQAVYFQGSLTTGGGTSIVAPELGGFFAQENAYLSYMQNQLGVRCFGNQACSPIGNANYYIYAAQQHAPNYAPHYPFYDILTGCAWNDISFNNPSVPYYCATTGYDLATGLGSANMLQLAWAINFSAMGDFGAPTVQFIAPPINQWYNTPQSVIMSFSDTTGSPHPPNGVAGFSLAWDVDPAPESFVKGSPGSNDAFYSGPQYPNQLRGDLELQFAGQGCHTAKAKAWDNTGWSSGVLSYGPLCYDTVAPQTAAALAGTKGSGGVYTSNVKITLSASDDGSGVAGRFYALGGGPFLTYNAPVTVTAPGAYTLRYYSSDVAGNSDSTHTVTFTIKSGTTTQLVPSASSPSYGQNLSLTATVSSTNGGALNGTVTFKDGNATLGTGGLNGGKAVFSTKSLQAGAHTITAAYAGNGTPSTSSAITVTVKKATTTTSLASSLNPATFAQKVTFTATVTPAFGGALDGTVTLKDGNTTLGTGAVDPATHKATFATTALSAAAHSITATYGGNGNNGGSTSASLTETVKKAPTTTTLASSANPATHGTSVTFTATVTPAFGGPIAGPVNFMNGGATLGSARVDPATHKATFATAALPVGTHAITAVYAGNPTHTGSTSAAVNQVTK